MISLCSDNFLDEHLDKVMSEGGCYLVFHGACLLVILKAIIFFLFKSILSLWIIFPT